MFARIAIPFLLLSTAFEGSALKGNPSTNLHRRADEDKAPTKRDCEISEFLFIVRSVVTSADIRKWAP